jgi:hypothetical protein
MRKGKVRMELGELISCGYSNFSAGVLSEAIGRWGPWYHSHFSPFPLSRLYEFSKLYFILVDVF